MIKNDLGYVFGGYTAVPWSSTSSSSSGYKSDSTAFIFSLTNPANSPLKLNVVQPENAVFHYPSWGHDFGGGNDLYFGSFEFGFMSFDSYQSLKGLTGPNGGKYVVGGSTHYYKSLEIEVFQVI